MLNPDSAIPRQLSVRGGRNKVQRAEASKAVLPVDLPELLLLSRCMLRPAGQSGMPRGLAFIRLGRPANDATGTSGISMGRVVEVGTQVTIHGREPDKISPELSPVSNSLTVSRAEQNI